MNVIRFQFARAIFAWLNQLPSFGRLSFSAATLLIACNTLFRPAIADVFEKDENPSIISPFVAGANSLNGMQVVLKFSQALLPGQALSTGMVQVVAPLGHTPTGIRGDLEKGLVYVDVEPPLRLAEATLQIAGFKLASGESVSGTLRVNVRNLSSIKLNDGLPWQVTPIRWDTFQTTVVGRGLSEAADEVGFLGVSGVVNDGVAAILEKGEDLGRVSVGIMLRSSGPGLRPYYCVLFERQDENTVRVVAFQRNGSGDFSTKLLETLPLSTRAMDPAYRMYLIKNGLTGNVILQFRGGDTSKNLSGLEIEELSLYNQFGIVAHGVSENANEISEIRFLSSLYVESPTMFTSVKMGENGLIRLTWMGQESVPVLIRQFSPLLKYEELMGIKTGVSNSMYLDIPAGASSEFFTLKRLKN